MQAALIVTMLILGQTEPSQTECHSCDASQVQGSSAYNNGYGNGYSVSYRRPRPRQRADYRGFVSTTNRPLRVRTYAMYRYSERWGFNYARPVDYRSLLDFPWHSRMADHAAPRNVHYAPHAWPLQHAMPPNEEVPALPQEETPPDVQVEPLTSRLVPTGEPAPSTEQDRAAENNPRDNVLRYARPPGKP